MAFGISNSTITTLQNITEIANITDPAEFFITADQIMFGGWFWFIILLILGIIIYVITQEFEDQPIINLMYTCTGLTILAFLNRAYCMSFRGAQACLISDWQMWMFPIALILTAGIVYFIKD